MAETVPAKIEEPKFQPYVPPDEIRPEFTIRAIVLGGFFGILFGAVTVYVGLRAGLTVAASIPIAVLSISMLRALGKASILENNIVQTAGSAGESVAGGVIFTLPALIFLGFPLEYSRIFLLALIGGWLGVLLHDPAAPPVDRERARQPALPRRHSLRRRAHRRRQRRIICQPRLRRSGPGRLYTPSSRMKTCSRSGRARPPTIRTGIPERPFAPTPLPNIWAWATSLGRALPV